ncbi:acyl carrier protein [Halomonas nitroreducens]|uniref:Acyl carrier protein n=1 Tax=Halomonas nitroreducens TaxID=447425 RepID=A0A3S0I6I1_9GAMM|nr:acyl carrier protein [Halomonas nitroreducens]RTR01107.1 acyl carrier protein [Halomonas nitroreducens]
MAELSRETIRDTAIDCILSVAPEAEIDRLRHDRPWREQLEVDSFDFLNVLVALETRLGVSVPEGDYHELTTLDGLVAYLEARLAETPP